MLNPVLAARGDERLWPLALERFDPNIRDIKSFAPKMNTSLVNKDGENLLVLAVQFLDEPELLEMIHHEQVNLAECVNQRERTQGSTPLIMAANMHKWVIARALLGSSRMKDEAGKRVMDVHLTDKGDQIALVVILLAQLNSGEQDEDRNGEGTCSEACQDARNSLLNIATENMSEQKESKGEGLVSSRGVGTTQTDDGAAISYQRHFVSLKFTLEPYHFSAKSL